MLRNDFAKKIDYKMERRSAISKELEFLRPFINKCGKRQGRYPTMKRHRNREVVTILVTTSTYPYQAHRNTQTMVTNAEVFIAYHSNFVIFSFDLLSAA